MLQSNQVLIAQNTEIFSICLYKYIKVTTFFPFSLVFFYNNIYLYTTPKKISYHLICELWNFKVWEIEKTQEVNELLEQSS